MKLGFIEEVRGNLREVLDITSTFSEENGEVPIVLTDAFRNFLGEITDDNRFAPHGQWACSINFLNRSGHIEDIVRASKNCSMNVATPRGKWDARDRLGRVWQMLVGKVSYHEGIAVETLKEGTPAIILGHVGLKSGEFVTVYFHWLYNPDSSSGKEGWWCFDCTPLGWWQKSARIIVFSGWEASKQDL